MQQHLEYCSNKWCSVFLPESARAQQTHTHTHTLLPGDTVIQFPPNINPLLRVYEHAISDTSIDIYCVSSTIIHSSVVVGICLRHRIPSVRLCVCVFSQWLAGDTGAAPHTHTSADHIASIPQPNPPPQLTAPETGTRAHTIYLNSPTLFRTHIYTRESHACVFVTECFVRACARPRILFSSLWRVVVVAAYESTAHKHARTDTHTLGALYIYRTLCATCTTNIRTHTHMMMNGTRASENWEKLEHMEPARCSCENMPNGEGAATRSQNIYIRKQAHTHTTRRQRVWAGVACVSSLTHTIEYVSVSRLVCMCVLFGVVFTRQQHRARAS